MEILCCLSWRYFSRFSFCHLHHVFFLSTRFNYFDESCLIAMSCFIQSLNRSFMFIIVRLYFRQLDRVVKEKSWKNFSTIQTGNQWNHVKNVKNVSELYRNFKCHLIWCQMFCGCKVIDCLGKFEVLKVGMNLQKTHRRESKRFNENFLWTRKIIFRAFEMFRRRFTDSLILLIVRRYLQKMSGAE